MNCTSAKEGEPPAAGRLTRPASADEAPGPRPTAIFTYAVAAAVAAPLALLAFTVLPPLLGIMIGVIAVVVIGVNSARASALLRRFRHKRDTDSGGASAEGNPDRDRFHGDGFRSKQSAAGAVVSDDLERLAGAGTSPAQVADLLGDLHRGAITQARSRGSFGEFLRGDKWLAELPPAAEHHTRQDITLVLGPFTLNTDRCAWGCRIDAPEPGAVLVVNRDLAEYCHLTALALHYICRHGFFGNPDSPHRVDPIALARALGLTISEAPTVRRVGVELPRAWENRMGKPFRAPSVELALLDIYFSYKDGNTVPYLVSRSGSEAGRVWPLEGPAVGISREGAVVGASGAPTRLVPTGHGVVISGDGMAVNGKSGATTLRHRDIIETLHGSFLFVAPHEPFVAPSGWLR